MRAGRPANVIGKTGRAAVLRFELRATPLGGKYSIRHFRRSELNRRRRRMLKANARRYLLFAAFQNQKAPWRNAPLTISRTTFS